ncbi:DUF1338 family protein [Staphylococcus epidermidis]|nr:DUF1338 family protein [Staphylococcus epidermidis]
MERHGAIRVGTPEELATLRRLFAVMGMEPWAITTSRWPAPVHPRPSAPCMTTRSAGQPVSRLHLAAAPGVDRRCGARAAQISSAARSSRRARWN